MKRWIAADAVVEPAPGGTVRWTHENGATMIGSFVELDPPRRLVFTYGWQDDLMGLPPGSSTVEIDLEEQEGGTVLRLSHSGIPVDVVEDHRRGWILFLGRLPGRPRGKRRVTVLPPAVGRAPPGACGRTARVGRTQVGSEW